MIFNLDEVEYICYGVPYEKKSPPPDEIKNVCDWLALTDDENGKRLLRHLSIGKKRKNVKSRRFQRITAFPHKKSEDFFLAFVFLLPLVNRARFSVEEKRKTVGARIAAHHLVDVVVIDFFDFGEFFGHHFAQKFDSVGIVAVAQNDFGVVFVALFGFKQFQKLFVYVFVPLTFAAG